MYLLGSSVNYHMASTLFLTSPLLCFPMIATQPLTTAGISQTAKAVHCSGSVREWPRSPFYINLLEKYKGVITLHHQYLTNIFIKIVLSVSIHSPPSLNPRPERGWVMDIAKCPFGIHPSDTKAFIHSQACLLDTSQSESQQALPAVSQKTPITHNSRWQTWLGSKRGRAGDRRSELHCRTRILAPKPLLFPFYYLWHLVKSHHFFLNDSDSIL